MPGAREKDIFDGENDNFENPLSAKVANGSETATPSAEDGASAAEMIAANDAEMTEDELVDLTYAFQAADMDGGGAIDIGGSRVSTPHVLECGNGEAI